MPATSKKMKTKFCIAYSIKKGETPRSYSAECAKMADEMSLETLREYCEAPVKEK